MSKEIAPDSEHSQPQPPKTDEQHRQQDKVRTATVVVLVTCLLLFSWYLIADRLTPSTSQARVRAFVIPVTPEVSGTVLNIGVENNQIVEQGQLLLEIDPSPYQLAVAKAEADLELAGQQTGSDVEAVSAAQAAVLNARADKINAEAQARRVLSLTEKGIMAQSFGDQAKAAIAKSNAALDKAEADLRAAKRRMGQAGAQNAKLRAAFAALRQARLDLQNTSITSPHSGAITNLQIELGHYAQLGTPLMTFVSATDVWVEAYMRENNLERIKPGAPVELVLDAAPGRVFDGVVASVGYGVNWQRGDSLGGLQSVESQSGWLRTAQRMPVIIRFSDDSSRGLRRIGGQADVIVYTGDHWLMNLLGMLQIRLISLLSYAY